MLTRKFIFTCLFAFFSMSLAPALAQTAQVRSIPVRGVLFGVKLSPDGQTAAIFENVLAHQEELVVEYIPIRLIDIPTGEQTAALVKPPDYAMDVAFTPDGKTLASYHGGGYIYLWDVATAAVLKRIPAIPGGTRIEFLPDGKTLVYLTSGTIPQILLWDTDTGYITGILMNRFATWRLMLDYVRQGIPDNYAAFDVSPDGAQIAVATTYANIVLWDIASGEPTVLRKSDQDLPLLSIRAIQFSPDGSYLAYADHDTKMFHVIDAARGTDLTTLEGDAVAFALSPDGNTVAWLEASDESPALKWASLAQPDSVQSVPIPVPDGLVARTLSLAFTADGEQVVLGGFDALDTGDNVILVVNLSA